MKILINTATTYKGGSVQVAYSFLQECKKEYAYKFLVVLGLSLQKLIKPEEFPANFRFEKVSYRPAQQVFSLKDQAKQLKKLEEEFHPDVVFTTSGPAYWRPRAKHLMGYNLAHYIYKDSPFFKMISLKQQVFWALKGIVIKYYTQRDADAYVVQTEDISIRLKKWINKERVYTVGNTYGAQFESSSIQPKLLPHPNPNEFRLLLISSYYKHKHIEIINEIVDYFHEKESTRFILTIPEKTFQSIFSEKAKKYIYNIGPIAPDMCPGLYSECNAVFLPTLLECFSATYAEAMKMRLPIITTDLSFAHAVCGKAALYFKPKNASDAYRKIKLLQENINIYNSLLQAAAIEIKKLLSPEERAESFLTICKSLLNK